MIIYLLFDWENLITNPTAKSPIAVHSSQRLLSLLQRPGRPVSTHSHTEKHSFYQNLSNDSQFLLSEKIGDLAVSSKTNISYKICTGVTAARSRSRFVEYFYPSPSVQPNPARRLANIDGSNAPLSNWSVKSSLNRPSYQNLN